MNKQAARPKISPVAFGLVGARGAMIAFGAWVFPSVGSSETATWTSFPWFSGLAMVCGLISLLMGANADGPRYRGKGTLLAKNGLLAPVFSLLAAGGPVGVAILLGKTIALAIDCGFGGLIVFQTVMFWTSLFRHHRAA